MLHFEAENTGKKAVENTVDEKLSKRKGDGFSTTSQTDAERDEAFDRAIREKLSADLPDSIGQWGLLSKRLELIEDRIRNIYRQKLLETAIILLLFFSAQNLFDFNFHTTENLTNVTCGKRDPETGITAVENNATSGKTAKSPSSRPIAHTLHTNFGTKNTGQTGSLTSASSTGAQLTASGQTIVPYGGSVLAVCTNLASMPLPTFALKNVSSAKEEGRVLLRTPEIPKDNHRYAISFVTVVNLNQICTPQEIFMGNTIESYNKFNLSGGGGFTISRTSRKHTLETGMIYLSKRYHPKQLNLTSADSKGALVRETLHTVELNMLEIPLNLIMRKELKNEKVSIFGGMGSTVNLVTNANYDISRQYLSPVSGVSALGNTREPSELQKIKKFNAGLFEGGGLRQNTYLSAQLMLGIEYRFAPKLSFFSQATLQRQVSAKGIGANSNHYHCYSAWMGLKKYF
jgi:hypothetical protein